MFEAQRQTEHAQEEAGRQIRELESALGRHVADAQSARGRIRELEKGVQAYREVHELADALSEEWAQPLACSDEAERLHGQLDERQRMLRRELDATTQAQKELRETIYSTEQSGCLPEVLRRACSQVDGELLVDRFEEVPLEEAGRVQARLGPLYEAILVDDVSDAVSRLSALDGRQRPDTVWLLEADMDLHALLEAGRSAGTDRDVWVPGASGHRLTRVPERPVLGALARRRRVSELRQHEQRLGEQLVELQSESDQLQRGLERLVMLLKQSSVLDRGDPSAELERVRQVEQLAEEAQPPLRERIAQRERERAALAERKSRLQALSVRAHVLDLPDQRELAETLSAQLQQAQKVKRQLDLLAGPRRIMQDEIDVLRHEPLSEAQRDELAAQKTRIEAERDRQAALLRNVHYLLENGAALDWHDAAAGLAARTSATTVLKEQLLQAQRERESADRAREEADKRNQQALKRALGLEAALEQEEQKLAELTEAHAQVGGAEREPAAAAQKLQEQETQLAELVLMVSAQERQAKERLEERAALKEREKAQKARLEGLQMEAGKAERAARPEQERCERLERRAQEARVLGSALAERYVGQFADKGAVNLWSLATAQRTLLCERLRQIREGADVARQVELFSSDTEQSSGEAALDGWLRVRGFLLRCIPAQIAEASDPESALSRLREHLSRLSHKLSQQEERLRGNSQDVAHNIEGLVRKARKQVSRLNQDLGMVRFGSIVGVRIKVVSVERMERVLHALKEGAVQTLLFQNEMPLEEALEEIFKSYGGGRSGGHKLLDYREYLELVVEIRRQVGTEWEPVNATKMSTGEAIGVGAAVMMVILTAWERDANLLRPKRTAGTLRLLFLDEANRLSRDSLDVLFDLCEGLELQLLIAAPEVANAEGNITHHLVRTVEQGREEVRVSARQVARSAKGDEAAVHVA